MKKTNKITLATVTLLTAFTLATALTTTQNVYAYEPVTEVPNDIPGVTYTLTPKYKVVSTFKLDTSRINKDSIDGYEVIDDNDSQGDSNVVPKGYVHDKTKTDFYENYTEENVSVSLAHKFFTPEKPSEDVKPEVPVTPEKPSEDVKPTTPADTKVVNKDSKATLPNTGDASILSLIAGLSGLSLFGFKTRKNK